MHGTLGKSIAIALKYAAYWVSSSGFSVHAAAGLRPRHTPPPRSYASAASVLCRALIVLRMGSVGHASGHSGVTKHAPQVRRGVDSLRAPPGREDPAAGAAPGPATPPGADGSGAPAAASAGTEPRAAEAVGAPGDGAARPPPPRACSIQECAHYTS